MPHRIAKNFKKEEKKKKLVENFLSVYQNYLFYFSYKDFLYNLKFQKLLLYWT